MQVVFLKDVAKVARKGDVKNVKTGYFSNYLFPNKVAVMASPAMLKHVEVLKKQMMLEKARVAEQAQEIKNKLEDKKFTLKQKAKGEKLYGSITEKDICDVILKETKISLSKENVVLSGHIKVVGSYEITLKLSDEISAKVLLEVKGEK
jgi:large subunit ribosomal protein L9